MKELAFGVGATVAALAFVGVIVFGARDTALFVPPPESVTENFARGLAAGRYQLARRHLSRGGLRAQSAAEIGVRFGPWRAGMGKVDRAEARELSKDESRANAACDLHGDRSVVTLTVSLVRENGLWKVDNWEAAGRPTR